MLVTGVDLELEKPTCQVGGVSYGLKPNFDVIFTKLRIKVLHEDMWWTDLWFSYSGLTSNCAEFLSGSIMTLTWCYTVLARS